MQNAGDHPTPLGSGYEGASSRHVPSTSRRVMLMAISSSECRAPLRCVWCIDEVSTLWGHGLLHLPRPRNPSSIPASKAEFYPLDVTTSMLQQLNERKGGGESARFLSRPSNHVKSLVKIRRRGEGCALNSGTATNARCAARE